MHNKHSFFFLLKEKHSEHVKLKRCKNNKKFKNMTNMSQESVGRHQGATTA